HIDINYRYASILIRQKKLAEARTLLMNNIRIIQEIESLDFHRLSETYLMIGEIYFQQGEYKNAYNWFYDALEELESKLENSNLDSNNNSSKILSSIFIDLKLSLARICTILFNETGDMNYMDQSLDLYSDIIEGLNIFRVHMKNQSSKLQNTESRIDLMKEAIELALKVYRITGEEKYIDLAYYYTENTKSFVLLSEIRSMEAMQFADLPNAILEKESGLSNEITAYEEMIFDAKLSSEPDSSLLATLESSLFQLNDDYHTLHDSIENNYPKYFQLKYSSNFISPSTVQKNLPRNEALVEYVLSDTVLTTFVIDNDNIQVLSQEVEADFAKECFDYFTLLQSQDFSKDVHETYREYIRMGRKFHEILVEPVLEVTESREITFIPDGAIMYLPFESFITKDVDTEYIAYNDLPYLIYDISVGYSYSSTMLFSPRVRSKTPERKVLAFAPSYENLLGEDEPIEWNRQANPDMLMPLPGAREEVKFISKAVPSDVYLGIEATEEHFKEYASDYSILHLAMHTIMNDEDPMFSKLAFTRNFNDSTQDHDLYTYEIYNMKLNADMVVLSSCSSGYGKMQKGEGMMSMARGFIYAGCPSIVMTLWQVSDRSSSELMSGFYKNLRKGKTKKKALRQAKIDYIKSSDNLKSNPYFWSAFMVVGDNSPLYGTGAAVYFGIIISFFILIVIGLSYKKQLLKLICKRK
ncbi:MAG: CHAT domain-containing protein, partial [Bacteroidales bacterium]|nr:CHAT domain-containing protein [Bacteroidales bacterium]